MTDDIRTAVARLEQSYLAYASAQKDVLEQGERALQPLIEALNNKHPNPIIKALGLLLLTAPGTDAAIPILVRNLFASHRVFQAALEAVVRAGARVMPVLMAELDERGRSNDDEAVRHLLAAAVQMPDVELHKVVAKCIDLLSHRTDHIREAAANALAHIGLPHGRCAVEHLLPLTRDDTSDSVRSAASEALARLGIDPAFTRQSSSEP